MLLYRCHNSDFMVVIKVKNRHPSDFIRLVWCVPLNLTSAMFHDLFPANQHARPRQLPMCFKQYGPTKNFEVLWTRRVGPRATLRYSNLISGWDSERPSIPEWRQCWVSRNNLFYSDDDNINKIDAVGVSKPTTSGVTKKSKSGKQGGDDITLPLMDKNQGQVVMAVFCQQKSVIHSSSKTKEEQAVSAPAHFLLKHRLKAAMSCQGYQHTGLAD